MIYTVVPIDMVLEDNNFDYSYEQRVVNDRLIEVRKVNSDFYVSKLISTNPYEYLEDRFFPGSKL